MFTGPPLDKDCIADVTLEQRTWKGGVVEPQRPGDHRHQHIEYNRYNTVFNQWSSHAHLTVD